MTRQVTFLIVRRLARAHSGSGRRRTRKAPGSPCSAINCGSCGARSQVPGTPGGLGVFATSARLLSEERRRAFLIT